MKFSPNGDHDVDSALVRMEETLFCRRRQTTRSKEGTNNAKLAYFFAHNGPRIFPSPLQTATSGKKRPGLEKAALLLRESERAQYWEEEEVVVEDTRIRCM